MAILKIAKPGGSVYDEEKNLAFTSKRDCLIELFSGTQTVNTTGYFQHSLGYTPSYTAFMKVSDVGIVGVPNNSWSPCVGFIGNGVNGGLVTVDTDKLYFQSCYDTSFNLVSTDFYYSIFGNTISNQTGTGKDNVKGKLRVAKSGFSVPNIKDARQFQFFSGNVLKQDISLSGSIDITLIDYDFTVVSVTHNLGYVPIVFAFENNNGSRIPYGNPDGTVFSYFIDSTKVYFVGGNLLNPGGDTYTLKYIITRDKIA